MLIQGYGAGAAVIADGDHAIIMSIATIKDTDLHGCY